MLSVAKPASGGKKLILLAICLLPLNSFAQSWLTQYTGVVYDVSFPDSLHGWAAAGAVTNYKGKVLYTNDGGKTWNAKTMGNPADTINMHKICFADSLKGWAGGTRAETSTGGYFGLSWFMASTSDGFNTCSSNGGSISSHYQSGDVSDIETVSYSVFWSGWWVSDPAGCYDVYVNGALKFDNTNYLWAMSFSFITTNYGWAVLHAGTYGGESDFFKTTTGVNGLTYLYDLPYIRDISFIDTLHGWAVGDLGKIFYTDKGGTDSVWEKLTSGVTNNLTCVKFVDQLNGWAGGNGIILRTRNGGVTWVTEATISGTISRICALDTTYVWALFPANRTGTPPGSILKYHPYVGVEESTTPLSEAKSVLGGPNPFVHFTQLSVKDKGTKIRIYDMTGRLIEETKNNVIGKNLQPGIYFVSLNKSKPIKIIKLSNVR